MRRSYLPPSSDSPCGPPPGSPLESVGRGFRSQLLLLSAVWPWTSHVPSLSLSFPILTWGCHWLGSHGDVRSMYSAQHGPLLDKWRGWLLLVTSFSRGERARWAAHGTVSAGCGWDAGAHPDPLPIPRTTRWSCSAAPWCSRSSSSSAWPPRASATASASWSPPAMPRSVQDGRKRGPEGQRAWGPKKRGLGVWRGDADRRGNREGG